MDRKAMRMLIAMQTEANTQEQKDQESKEIREKLFEMQRYKDSLRVGTYLSRPEQVDTIEIVKKMVQENKKVFIPKRITNDDIDMVLYDGKTDLNELHPNTSAFKPPDVCDPQQSALETGGLDLLLITGFAFTETGRRLGDRSAIFEKYVMRLRKLCPNTTVIGLAWKHQIVDAIPQFNEDMQRPDITVDIVLHAHEENLDRGFERSRAPRNYSR
ncbi:5-formyltetrahydrofolate cyclo-ligase isoform X3 [Bemisia tabaci]